MKKNEIALRPSYWASVSGGKDSLYMLKLILENRDKYPLDGVVHFELEIDYPFIKNVIDYMESECNKFGIKFYRIKPRTSWKELYNKYGFPTGRVRWCNGEYKLDAKAQLKEFLLSVGCKVITYIGYCADEEKRFTNRNKDEEIYPLVDFNVSESTILEWAQGIKIFNDYYIYNKRCGCMYCPISSMLNQAYLLCYYPDYYKTMINLAVETEKKISKKCHKKFCIFDGHGIYDAEYRDKRIRDYYLPKIQKIRQENIDK